MPTWNDRILPHPLLAPWTDDYGDATFTASVPDAVLNNGRQISLNVKFHLTSQVLRRLIDKHEAQYVLLITCPETFSRDIFHPDQEDEFVLPLEASGYSRALELTPYIVAVCKIGGFIADEHAEEFRHIKPHGFDISPGSILSVGESFRIALEDGGSAYSVIDLVADRQIENGVFTVYLENNRIEIRVSERDKKYIEALRKSGLNSIEREVLFPSIYLHAVIEALRNLRDYKDTNKQWARTMIQALERHDISADDEELEFYALKHAQSLMEGPVGRLLTAFTNRDM